jgi:hypothetical protein
MCQMSAAELDSDVDYLGFVEQPRWCRRGIPGVAQRPVDLIALGRIGHTRPAPAATSARSWPSCCVDLPSRSLRHHPLGLAMERSATCLLI